MASGQPVQVMGPLLTIPSTLKRIFSTSATFSSYGFCAKSGTANCSYHILNRNPIRIVKDIRPFLLEAYDRLLYALQPFQGLFDHGWSSSSGHAVHGQGDLFQLTS